MTASEGGHAFDHAHAREYERKSRIALAGYDAFHELTACILKAAVGEVDDARVLVVGAGTGKEIVTTLRVAPAWRFLAVDPSEPMLDVARDNVATAGAADRVSFQCGTIADVGTDDRYDAATLIGVLHHVPGAESKVATLRGIADRLHDDAPLVLASHHGRFSEQPLLLDAWMERSRLHGASSEQVAAMREKLRVSLDAPASEEVVTELLGAAGFGRPLRYFTSLFWGAWVAWKE